MPERRLALKLNPNQLPYVAGVIGIVISIVVIAVASTTSRGSAVTTAGIPAVKTSGPIQTGLDSH